MGLWSVWLYCMVITIMNFANRVPRYRNKKITDTTFSFSRFCVNPSSMNSLTLLFISMVMVNVEQAQLRSGSSAKKKKLEKWWLGNCNVYGCRIAILEFKFHQTYNLVFLKVFIHYTHSRIFFFFFNVDML